MPQVETLLEQMPWRAKFTEADRAVIEARIPRIVDAMTDAVGLFGQTLGIPVDCLKILAVHVAMAGDFFNDGHGKFIEWRLRDVQSADGHVVYKDVREWRKVGEFGDEPQPDPDKLAQAAVAQINAQLPPEVRRKIKELMSAEYEKATT